MDTVKINLPCSAFSEIRDEYPEPVLNDIPSGAFQFTDRSVILPVPAMLLDKEQADS